MTRAVSRYLRPVIVVGGYLASASVLWLQLFFYQGTRLSGVVIYLVQAILYGLIVLKVWSFRPRWAFGSAFIVAWIIGWMPIGQTLLALKEFVEGGMEFSSLTRNLPIAVRVLYEFGGFPLLQFLILAAAVGLLRAIQRRFDGDTALGV